jgi:hypothetical protein
VTSFVTLCESTWRERREKQGGRNPPKKIKGERERETGGERGDEQTSV